MRDLQGIAEINGPRRGELQADRAVLVATESLFSEQRVHPDTIQTSHGKRVALRQQQLVQQQQAKARAPAPKTPTPPILTQDLIGSAIDYHQSHPFMVFWQGLINARGADVGYPEARALFEGGPTPVGALTFIGREFEGLRAIPADPDEYLGGKRPAYHGEYREVTVKGVIWHKVRNNSQLPIVYSTVEAALKAAMVYRDHG